MRRNVPITIEDEGRDKGKRFIITEMPATQADAWVTQAQYLIEKASLEFAGLPDDHAVLALARIRALKDQSLEGWWDCVRFQHPEHPNNPPQAIVHGANCQIEEVRTVNRLLMATYELHTGFFSPEKESTTESPSISLGSSVTRTFHRPSGPLSPQGRPRSNN